MYKKEERFIKWIEKSNKTWDNKYDYSNTDFKNATTKVEIICPKHGSFWQDPYSHHKGYQGCSKCLGKNYRNSNSFIQESKEKYPNLFTYKNTIYDGIDTKTIITCNKHGDFEITPWNHLHRKYGCPKCGNEKCGEFKKLSKNEILKRFKNKHGNKYNYSKVDFNKNVSEKVKIICPKHGIFEQRISEHFIYGCQRCAWNKSNYEKYKNKQTILYYIYFPKEKVYKIGLTQSSLSNRYRKDIQNGYNFIILSQILYKDGWKAYRKEQFILNKYKHLKSDKIFLNGGNTELFKLNILN